MKTNFTSSVQAVDGAIAALPADSTLKTRICATGN